MNILVSTLGYDNGKSGISSYMRNVLAHLKNQGGCRLTLVVESGVAEEDFKDFEKIVVPPKMSKSAAGFLWHLLVLPFKASCKKYDVLLTLAANRRFTLFCKIPQVGVVHDLSQYRVSEKYDALRMFYLTKIQPMLGRGIDSVAAISKSTAADVGKYWRVDADRITLNYNGLNRLQGGDDKVLGRLNLDKYIYYVSRIEHPGKNHLGLIKAYEALPNELKNRYKLVFTGSKWSGAETVLDYISSSPDRDRIVVTGFVSDGELASLYKNASAFVFPSFSEGFGLPLIEAFACGVPCACSKDSALGEIGADAALKFDPADTAEISECLKRLLSDDVLRAELSKKGVERAKIFDWEKHAQVLAGLCRREYDKNSKLKIFGVNFVNLRFDDCMGMIEREVLKDARRACGFVNTHYLNTAYEIPEQVGRLNSFDYVFPDGSGVSLACKIMGYRYRDNLNGTDMMPKLCALSEKRGFTMFFFGGKAGVAQRAVDNLKKDFPDMRVAGIRDGYFKPEENGAIVSAINAVNPDFLFVGFGAPLQEKWLAENFLKLNCRMAFAIGGVCDVYSGDLFRVNPWLRKHGCEWLGRFWQDPIRLFGRYAIGNPLFLLRVAMYRIKLAFRAKGKE